MFEGGYYTEQKPGTAALTLLMLKEGAAGKSSEEIAESFDYHGAWLQTSASSHYLYVTLYRSIGISTPAYLYWQTSLYGPISRKKNSPGSKNGVSNNCSFRKKK